MLFQLKLTLILLQLILILVFSFNCYKAWAAQLLCLDYFLNNHQCCNRLLHNNSNIAIAAKVRCTAHPAWLDRKQKINIDPVPWLVWLVWLPPYLGGWGEPIVNTGPVWHS